MTEQRVPNRIRIHCDDGGGVRLEAAAPVDGSKPPLRKFAMTAYTGGAMVLAGWNYPVVVDLLGLRVSQKARPILKDHNASQIVGHTSDIVIGQKSVEVAGVISGTGAAAQEIIGTSENGFPWQSSLGATAEKVVFITEGKTAQANGREFTGPVYIARKSVLGEVSFVALGADDDTFARVAAEAGAVGNVEVTTMEFEQWAADHGFQLEGLADANVTSLKAMFAQESTSPADDVPNPVTKMRSQAAAEARRIAAIRKVCGNKFPDIEAQAIADGWDETKTELAVVRASRPTAPQPISRPGAISGTVLEAAICVAGKFPGVEKHYKDEVLQAAHTRFRGRIGLQEVFLEAAWANGYSGYNFKADVRGVLEAAFSTFNLPSLLISTANKFALQAFNAVESNWRSIAAIRPVTDFKQVTSYRLVADLMYEEVGPDGELKHGKVGEEEFSNQAKTYGKLLSITRKDLYNDDLGRLTAVPAQMGRGAALKLNDVFWRTFLDNAAFFVAGNKNYAEGADTALNIDGLTKAEQLFFDQVSPDGHPLGIAPEILLVPNALFTTAQQLMNATQIFEDGNTSPRKFPTNNPHAGKFRVQRSSYLSNPLYPGNSSKAWYLLADPNNLPVIEVAFLNGQETPTVETADADFKELGIQLRGFHDFGCARQDPRAGVKLKGQ